MRTLRLLATAAEAEGLRLKRTGAAMGRRAALSAIAAAWALAAIIMAHLAAWHLLVPPLGAAGAAGAVAIADLLVASACLLLARPRNDPVAQEALMLRRAMLRAAIGPGATRSLLSPAVALGGMIAELVLRRGR